MHIICSFSDSVRKNVNAVFSCKIICIILVEYCPAVFIILLRAGDRKTLCLSVFKMYISYKFSQHNKSPQPQL